MATNGSDSNPGTQSAPFGTIRKGLATIHAGDTLYLRGGTYNEAISSNNQTIPTGTSWSNPVTIASYPGESAILQPSGVGGVIDFNAYNTSYHIQYIIFDRLILDGSNALTVASLLGNSNGFQTHHIRFQNGEIRYSSGCGGGYHIVGPISQPGPTGQGNQVNIQLFGGYNNEFLNSKIHNSWCGYGFYVNGHDHLIDGKGQRLCERKRCHSPGTWKQRSGL